MPRSSGGVYSRPASDVNPPVNLTFIDPVAFDAAIADIATELTNSVDRLGRGAAQADLPMGGFKIKGLAAPVLAGDAASLGTLQGYLPAGTVIMHAASTPPSGWLECNGSAVSRVGQAALFAIIGTTWGVGDGSTTFNLPDFRGYAPRGWDNARGIDPARTFASTQADGLKTHTHVQNAHTHTDAGHIHSGSMVDGLVGASGGAVNAGLSAVSTGTGFANISSTTAVNQATGGAETVMKNISCLFIIRT